MFVNRETENKKYLNDIAWNQILSFDLFPIGISFDKSMIALEIFQSLKSFFGVVVLPDSHYRIQDQDSKDDTGFNPRGDAALFLGT